MFNASDTGSATCLHGQAKYCSVCAPTVASLSLSPSVRFSGLPAPRRDPGAIERVVHNVIRDLTSSQLFGLSPDDVADVAASELPAFLRLGLLSYLWASRGSIAQAISAADAQTDLLRVARAASSLQSVQVLTAAVLACSSVARLCRNEDVAEATFLGRRIAAVDALRGVIGDVAAWAAEWRDDTRSAERAGVDAALRLAADALLWAALDAVTELQRDARQATAVAALLRIVVRVEDVVPGAAAAPRAAALLSLAEEELFALSGAPQGSELEAAKLHAAAALLSRCAGLLLLPPPPLRHDDEGAAVASSVWHALLGACAAALQSSPIGGPPPPPPSPRLVGARLSDVLLQLGRPAQAVDVWFRLVAAPDAAPGAPPALRDGFAEVLGALELAVLLPFDDPSLGALIAGGWARVCTLADRALLSGESSVGPAQPHPRAGGEPDLLLADASMAALQRRCTPGDEGRSTTSHCHCPRSVCQAAIAASGGLGGGDACGLSVHLALQLLAAVALLRGDSLSAVGRHRAASHWYGRALFASLHLHHGCPHQLGSSSAAGRGPLQVRTWVAACRFVSSCIRAARSRAAARVSCLLLAAAGPQAWTGQHWSAALPSEAAGVLRVQGVLLASQAGGGRETESQAPLFDVAVQAAIDDLLAGDGVTPSRASVLSSRLNETLRSDATEISGHPRSPPRSARRGAVGLADPLKSEIDWLMLRADERVDLGRGADNGFAAEGDWAAGRTPRESSSLVQSSEAASFASPGIVQAYRSAAVLSGGVAGARMDAVGVAEQSPRRPQLPEWSPAPSGKPSGYALNISALDEEGGRPLLEQQQPIFADELEMAADRSSVGNPGLTPSQRPSDAPATASRAVFSAWAASALGSDALSLSEHRVVYLLALNMLGVALELANSAPAAVAGASSAQAALAAVSAAAAGFVALLKHQQHSEGASAEPGRFRIHELLSLHPWGGAVGAAALLPWRSGVRSPVAPPYGVAAALHWALPGIARYPPEAPLVADAAGAAQWVAAGPSEPILLAAATFEVNRGAAFAATLGQRLSAAPSSGSGEDGEPLSGGEIRGALAATLAATLRGNGAGASPRLAATLSSPTRESLAYQGRTAQSSLRAGPGGGAGSSGRASGAFSPHASRRGASALAPTLGAARAAGYAPTTPPRSRGSGAADLQSPGKRGAVLDALRAVTAGGATWAALGRQWSAAESRATSGQARGDAIADLEVLRANRVQSLLRRATLS